MLLSGTESVRLRQTAQNWREAVRAAGSLLVASGGVLPAYVEEMEKMVVRFGPYVVISKGLAIPHASPGYLVCHTCVSVVTLCTPVYFGNRENDPVDVLIGFAAIDFDHHMSVLARIARILLEHEGLYRIRNARSESCVTALFVAAEGAERCCGR